MKSIVLAGLLSIASTAAMATPITFTGSSGSYAASASFDVIGSQLQVVLANTSTADVLVPRDVLTALFFDIVGNPSLTRVSATSGGPSYIVGGANVSGAGTNVGGEWSYLSGLSQYSSNSGISSSGLGIFGPGNLFPGSNLSGTASPGGVDYGLVSAGDDPSTGNGGLQGRPFTKNSVTFLLDGLPSGFDLAAINNVIFSYGTALDEGHFEGTCTINCGGTKVPEPATLGLCALGLLGLATIRRRGQLRRDIAG